MQFLKFACSLDLKYNSTCCIIELVVDILRRKVFFVRDIKRTALQVIQSCGHIAKTADFTAAGLTSYDIAILCKERVIERIQRGFYQLKDDYEASEEVLLCKMLPQGIVCLESALCHYEYSDYVPMAWSVAVPRSAFRAVSKIKELPVKAYYIPDAIFSLGKTIEYYNDTALLTYDRERTICDCFKYRAKLDSEIFNKSVKAYAADDQKNIANLMRYARKMNQYDRMMNVMEVLLND